MKQKLSSLGAALRGLDRTTRLTADLDARVRRLGAEVAENERELRRISPQVAALEVRLNALEQRLEQVDYTGTDEEQREARSLVEEVRAEHARIRARISAAVVFEERIRVLEQDAGIDSATGRRREA